jgi:glycerate dehydrogenase
LRNLILGVVGFGRIGQRVAELCYAFGMRVLYVTEGPTPNVAFPAQRVDLKTLFTTSDIVTLHCSLSKSNRAFFDKRMLARMKPSAFLINAARGELINEPDLAEALRDGVLAGAALDVLSAEPPVEGNPLLRAPGCLITPQMAWASLAARQRILQTTMENIEAFMRASPINVVNPAGNAQ